MARTWSRSSRTAKIQNPSEKIMNMSSAGTVKSYKVYKWAELSDTAKATALHEHHGERCGTDRK